jgi:hypothetical protein
MSDFLFWSIMICLAVMGSSLLLAYRYPAFQLVVIGTLFLFLGIAFGASVARAYWAGVIIFGAMLAWLTISTVRDRKMALAQGKSWPEPAKGPLFLANWQSPKLRAGFIVGIMVGLCVPLAIAALMSD